MENDTKKKKKTRIVINIRILNNIALKNIYSIPVQNKILAVIKDAIYISTINYLIFFINRKYKNIIGTGLPSRVTEDKKFLKL